MTNSTKRQRSNNLLERLPGPAPRCYWYDYQLPRQHYIQKFYCNTGHGHGLKTFVSSTESAAGEVISARPCKKPSTGKATTISQGPSASRQTGTISAFRGPRTTPTKRPMLKTPMSSNVLSSARSRVLARRSRLKSSATACSTYASAIVQRVVSRTFDEGHKCGKGAMHGTRTEQDACCISHQAASE